MAVLAQVSSVLGEHLSSPFHREAYGLTCLPLGRIAGKPC